MPKENFPARLQKLCRAWQSLNGPCLRHRQKMLRAWASGYYDPNYSRQHIINLMDRGVSTLVPFLVEGDPSAVVEAKPLNLRPFAYTTQLALNFYIKKLNLAESTLIPAVTNSMFGMGITRTSLKYTRMINLNDEQVFIGTPWVDVIDDSDYIGDPAAKRREDFQFEGDVYTLPTDFAKEFFGLKFADYIQQDCKLTNASSPKEIFEPNFDRNKLSLREYTTFIDIYLPDEKKTVTIMPHGKKAAILREVDEEFDKSPYDVLSYKCFPETSIPLPPAWSWYDLDISANILADKMREQAEASKNLLLYTDQAEKDAERIKDASNNEAIRVEDIDEIKHIQFGGINPLNYEWIAYVENQHTKQGANPDVLGGRGASAPTLGQEQMVYSNATRIVNNMDTRFHRFCESILYKLSQGFWNDPTQYFEVVKEIPGVGSIPVIYSDVDKVGDFWDYNFKILQNSAKRTPPEVQGQRLMQFMSQWVLPTMQYAAQQGAQVDIPTATQILADYNGFDNFNKIYKTSVPTSKDQSPYMVLKSSGQMNDSFGATAPSREANLNQEQTRTGTGAEKEINNEKAGY